MSVAPWGQWNLEKKQEVSIETSSVCGFLRMLQGGCLQAWRLPTSSEILTLAQSLRAVSSSPQFWSLS